MGAPLPAQHGARKLFGSMPKATQSPRLGQAMRPQPGEGRAKSLHYPTRRIVQIAGYRGGRLRRSAELPQPGYRAGNTAHRGCRSWREPPAGLRAYRRGPALFWLRRRLRADRRNLFPTCLNEAVIAEQNGCARRRGRRRPWDTAGRKRGTAKNEHG